MIDLLRELFGSANKAALAAGVSRQRLNYWARKGFILEDFGLVVDSRGRGVGVIPVAPEALRAARSRLQWVSPDFPISPVTILGPLGRFLPRVINGRSCHDAAPAKEWIEWLQ